MTPTRTLGFLASFLVAFTVLSGSGYAQTANHTGQWETLRPEGEEFTILMPKNSTSEVTKEPYHKMTLNTRLYLWTSPSGPVFAVTSMSGIKANPALYTEMERVNSYVDAFRGWFPKKVRGKDAVAKLTLVGEKTLNGHSGRQYKLVIGDLTGTARVYATKKRFYAIASLNTKNDDDLSDRFLSSFVLPDKVVAPSATVAADHKPGKPDPEKTFEESFPPNYQGQKPDPKPDGKSDAKTQGEGATPNPTNEKSDEPVTANDAQGRKAPISGGVLNAKAITLPPPAYPPEARAARVTGTVVVRVTVDEFGNVVAAGAVSGHPLLQQAAVTAARQARFAPTYFMGEAVKVTGVLTYTFAAQ